MIEPDVVLISIIGTVVFVCLFQYGFDFDIRKITFIGVYKI